MEEFEFIIGQQHDKYMVELPRRWRWVHSDILCMDSTRVTETRFGTMVADTLTNSLARPADGTFRMSWFAQPIPITTRDGIVEVWASGTSIVFRGGCDPLPDPIAVIMARRVHVDIDVDRGSTIVKLKTPTDAKLRGMLVRGAVSVKIDNVSAINSTLATLLRCKPVDGWIHVVPVGNLNSECILHTGWRAGGFVCDIAVANGTKDFDVVYVMEN